MIETATESANESRTPYAESHCRQCALGWTREGVERGVHIVCLLDREPVLAHMTFCNRYELRQSGQSKSPAEAEA